MNMTLEPNRLVVNDRVSIPWTDIYFTFARSSGPGGQNVNKVATKVTLMFDINENATLTHDQKAQIRSRLASRIPSHGLLSVTSSRHRTQFSNREAAIHRFVELLNEALTPVKKRTRTRPTGSSKVRRLQGKRIRSGIKKQRGRVGSESD